jgi:WD40 repeat protein
MNMRQGIVHMDDMVREYLLFRGFTKTFQLFEQERRQDRLRSFDAAQIVEALLAHARDGQLEALQSLWRFLTSRLFSKAHPSLASVAARLERSLFRLYLVYAVLGGRRERVPEFFAACGPDVLRDPDWKPWFTLPYVRAPETDPLFAVYFSKSWIESFVLSLSNFLSSMFAGLAPPKLLAFNVAHLAAQQADCEIEYLKTQLESLRAQLAAASASASASAAGPMIPTAPIQGPARASAPDLLPPDDARSRQSAARLHSYAGGPASGLLAARGESRRIRASPEPEIGSELAASGSVSPLPASTGGVGGAQGGPPSGGGPSPTRGGGANVRASDINGSGGSSISGSGTDLLKRRSQASVDDLRTDPAQMGSDLLVSSSAVRSLSDAGLPVAGRMLSCVGHRAVVSAVRFSFEGDALASGDVDGSVMVWDMRRRGEGDGADASVPRTHLVSCYGRVQALEWEKRRDGALFCGTSDGRVSMHSAPTMAKSGEYLVDASMQRVVALAAATQLSRLAVVHHNANATRGQVTVWDYATGRQLRTYVASSGIASAACWVSGGVLLCIGGTGGSIDVVDVGSGAAIERLPASVSGAVLDLRFAGGSLFSLVSEGGHHFVQEWNLSASSTVHTLEVAAGSSMVVDPYATLVAVAPTDGQCAACVYMISPEDGGSSAPLRLRGHGLPVTSVDWHPRGVLLATASPDPAVLVHELHNLHASQEQ